MLLLNRFLDVIELSGRKVGFRFADVCVVFEMINIDFLFFVRYQMCRIVECNSFYETAVFFRSNMSDKARFVGSCRTAQLLRYNSISFIVEESIEFI
jgi:hypothetical protein